MYNWPGTTVATALIQSFIINAARFLALGRYMPLDVTTQENSERIRWDELGPILGMTSNYTLGTPTRLVKGQTITRREQGTAYWRDSAEVDEADLLRVASLTDPWRRQLAREDLILLKLKMLHYRNLIRMEWLCWQAMNNNLTAFTDDNGNQFSIDYGLTAPVQVSNWSDPSTATPVKDLQTVLLTYGGTGVAGVELVLNGKTSTDLSQNEEIIDRMRGSQWAGSTGTANIGELLMMLTQGNGAERVGPRLTAVTTYDEGYFDSSGVYQRFLPNDLGVLIGIGGPEYAVENGPDYGVPGFFMSTPALQDMGGQDNLPSEETIRPGEYATVKPELQISPKRVLVEAGINGLPVIQRKTWIKRIKTSAP